MLCLPLPPPGLCPEPHGISYFRLQVLSTAARVGVPMSGENALQRYDQWAFDKICDSAFGQSVMAGRLEVRRTAEDRCWGCTGWGQPRQPRRGWL